MSKPHDNSMMIVSIEGRRITAASAVFKGVRASRATWRCVIRTVPCSEQKIAQISHPLLNERTFIREYSKFRPIGHMSFKSFQCLLKSRLMVEYSRMNAPSLSSGCEICAIFCSPYRSESNAHEYQDDDSMTMRPSKSQDDDGMQPSATSPLFFRQSPF
jgi:hypothetical protein